MESRAKRVPMPVAFVILAVVGAIIWYGISRIEVLPHRAAPAAAPQPVGK